MTRNLTPGAPMTNEDSFSDLMVEFAAALARVVADPDGTEGASPADLHDHIMAAIASAARDGARLRIDPGFARQLLLAIDRADWDPDAPDTRLHPLDREACGWAAAALGLALTSPR
jgi:hypothetical protein